MRRGNIGVKHQTKTHTTFNTTMIQPLWETLPREDNLTIETVRTSKKYRQTNPIWNHEGFNHRKQIGSLTYLYKKGECDSVSSFETFYLQNGKETLGHRLKDGIYDGRTLEELSRLAIRFQAKLGNDCSLEECILYDWIRLFYETHLGMQRETKAIQNFALEHPDFTIIPTSIEVDVRFAVDAEVFFEGTLLYGLQVKSPAYLKNQHRILKETKQFNRQKNQTYQAQFDVPVHYLIADSNGNILDLIENY